MSKESRWVWQSRERGFWARLLFWRRTAIDINGVWVPRRSLIEEHAELLAADERERGW